MSLPGTIEEIERDHAAVSSLSVVVRTCTSATHSAGSAVDASLDQL
ncbi:hypothetical protein [Brevibacterium picturae]